MEEAFVKYQLRRARRMAGQLLRRLGFVRRRFHDRLVAELTEERDRLGRWRASDLLPVRQVPELEMALDNFDPREASARIHKYGCIIVRGNRLSRDVVAAYNRHLAEVGYYTIPIPRGGALWNPQRTKWYRDQVAAAHGGKSPVDFDISTERLEFPLHRFVQQALYDLCATHHETDILMSTVGTSASIRSVSAHTEAGLVKFHQDISPVGIARSLTFWILIEPREAGIEVPGLRFIVPKTGRRREHERHMADAFGYHEFADLRLSMDEYYWTPSIEVGDVVIFDPFSPHATYVANGMVAPRTSVDLRVMRFDAARANSLLENRHGLILFDRDGMLGPTRVAATQPDTEFEYGSLGTEAPGRALTDAFERAKVTRFVDPHGGPPTLERSLRRILLGSPGPVP